MSHFSVLVVTDQKPTSEILTKALQPFHEYECTGIEDEYVRDIDVTDETIADHAKYGEGEPLTAEWARDWNGATMSDNGKFYRRTNPDRKWDWWQVGGRWTGALVRGYDPEKDLRNRQTCDLCEGTGMRNDKLGAARRAEDPTFKCNGCGGAGERAKWPTQWVQFDGDTQPAPAIRDAFNEKMATFAVLKDGKWYERGSMGWWCSVSDDKEPDEWVKQVTELVRTLRDDQWVTVVDCHI